MYDQLYVYILHKKECMIIIINIYKGIPGCLDSLKETAMSTRSLVVFLPLCNCKQGKQQFIFTLSSSQAIIITIRRWLDWLKWPADYFELAKGTPPAKKMHGRSLKAEKKFTEDESINETTDPKHAWLRSIMEEEKNGNLGFCDEKKVEN